VLNPSPSRTSTSAADLLEVLAIVARPDAELERHSQCSRG
jgi:hypothetical protein